MKSDLDALLAANGLDAMLVTGSGQHNPAMVYLTGGGHFSEADLIKKRGEEAVLFHASMEREEAAHTGLQTRSFSNYPWVELMRAAGGDRARALAIRYQRMFEDMGLTSGKVVLYGHADVGLVYSVFEQLHQLMPDLTLVGDANDRILLEAMSTKDAAEVERIRKVGRITTEVVGQVADFLSGHAVKDGVLVRPDGEPLTIGRVKRQIDLWLAERGAENPEGTIFSIGRDAAIPHNSGTPTDLLRLGQTIVFDIYPCEAGGGYFHDFTRTWSLGYATDEVLQIYEQVLSVYRQILSELEVGRPCADYQRRTCELFEAMGHPTVLSNAETETGYVHSLGHGVGMQIHERPWFSLFRAASENVLKPGVVVAVEPGLYYPERGIGVRLENTVWVDPQGRMDILADYPLDLVLPVKG